MFTDRKDAGEKLAATLSAYRNKGVLVLGIPRGGVEVAYHVAKSLNAAFSTVIVRKLGYPSNPEAAFGAIAEDGTIYLPGDVRTDLSEEEVQEIIRQERLEISRRVSALRKGKPLPEMRGKTVILTDDGIATGATIHAAIALCKHQGAAKIIVAAPISGQRMDYELRKLVDDVVILEKPAFFYAVGQGYEHFSDMSDADTLRFIDEWAKSEKVKQ